MDTVTADLQQPHPWTVLYADDVDLAEPETAGGSNPAVGHEAQPERDTFEYQENRVHGVWRTIRWYNKHHWSTPEEDNTFQVPRECWPATVKHKQALHVMEMRML